MRIFSWLVNTTPAVCSPSRSVVSSMRTAGSAGWARGAMTKLERSLVMVTCLCAPHLRPGPGEASRDLGKRCDGCRLMARANLGAAAT